MLSCNIVTIIVNFHSFICIQSNSTRIYVTGQKKSNSMCQLQIELRMDGTGEDSACGDSVMYEEMH